MLEVRLTVFCFLLGIIVVLRFLDIRYCFFLHLLGLRELPTADHGQMCYELVALGMIGATAPQVLLHCSNTITGINTVELGDYQCRLQYMNEWGSARIRLKKVPTTKSQSN